MLLPVFPSTLRILPHHRLRDRGHTKALSWKGRHIWLLPITPALSIFKGNSYFFYHSHELSGGEGFKRSTCVEQFEYNPDGSIPLIEPTKQAVTTSVANLNPYQWVEAETIAWSEGLKTKTAAWLEYMSPILITAIT